MQTTEAVTATSPVSARPRLCRPLGRRHPRTEGAAEAALTGAASESGIMTHSFAPGPQETLTTSPAKCEPGGEELKKEAVKWYREAFWAMHPLPKVCRLTHFWNPGL